MFHQEGRFLESKVVKLHCLFYVYQMAITITPYFYRQCKLYIYFISDESSSAIEVED